MLNTFNYIFKAYAYSFVDLLLVKGFNSKKFFKKNQKLDSFKRFGC